MCSRWTPRMGLYTGPGRRRVLPPVVFGAGVLWHLLRHGARYDVIHTASFPYFSLLAAALARRRAGYRLVVDWHEVWTRDVLAASTWGGSAGPSAGWCRGCAPGVPQHAFCFSRLHAARLRRGGPPRRRHDPCRRVRRAALGARRNTRPSPSWCSPAVTSPRNACRRSCPRSPAPGLICRNSALQSSATARTGRGRAVDPQRWASAARLRHPASSPASGSTSY